MEEKYVWELCPIPDVPTGRKIIRNRWVMAEKDDGRLRAQKLAQGSSQISGQNFQESHAPVAKDTTMRMILIFKIIYSLLTGQSHVETNLLYSKLDEVIWMK